MKKFTVSLLLGMATAVAVRADTSLTINPTTPFGCLQNAFLWQPPLSVSGTFTLPGVSGTGAIRSGINASAPSFSFPPEIYFYNYTLNLSGLPAASNHCVKLLIHFGAPQGCDTDEVWGSPGQIQSATLAPFGDITFVFGGGCLSPSQPAVAFTMFSQAPPKTNIVTVIDDYIDPASGTTNEARINVAAIVPDNPPDPPFWLFVHPRTFPYAFFQGSLDLVGTNQTKTNLPVNGPYDFALQILSGSNGLAVSQVVTQTVPVANGLFNLPLPFDAVAMCDGSVRFLNIGVRPAGGNTPFTPLNSPLPITPTPQAFYAYTAGSVADLAPGQAVTTLNGLADAVQLLAGSSGTIVIGTNGNALTLDARPGVVSDRNRKTDFANLQPEEILARLAALPIQAWRYTNEMAGVRHVGPMAQDFKAAFGLGDDDKFIQFVDEEGVALAAIQGLNEKLKEKEKQLQNQSAEISDLTMRLQKLDQQINSQNKTSK